MQKRKIGKNEISETSNIANYLPHHGVFNVNKSGQLRVVFEVSVKYHGTSLNKNLLTGFNLLNNFISVLRRFRQGKFAVMADIKEMYHKVSLVETDALRFLWRDNPVKGLSGYGMLVQVFGKVDSPCCPNWALRQVPLKTDIFREDVMNREFLYGQFFKVPLYRRGHEKLCHVFHQFS